MSNIIYQFFVPRESRGGLFSDLAIFFVGLPLEESSVVFICSLVGLVKLSLTTREREGDVELVEYI